MVQVTMLHTKMPRTGFEPARLEGTGPQPAAYAYSATGATISLYSDSVSCQLWATHTNHGNSWGIGGPLESTPMVEGPTP